MHTSTAIQNAAGTIKSVQHILVTDEERAQLESSYRHLAFPEGHNGDLERFIADSTTWFLGNAPRSVVRAIQEWKANPGHAGAIIFDNLGVGGDLPDTPINGRRSPDKLNTYSEATSAAVSNMLGQLVAFVAERHGDPVQDLTPVEGKETSLTNQGTNALGWHAEHGATHLALGGTALVLAYLVFFHLRASHDGDAKTLVADYRDAFALLDPATIDTLFSPEFKVKPPKLVAETLPKQARVFRPVPLFTGPREAPQLQGALYGDLTEGLTDKASRALEVLKDALDSVYYQVTTKPGRLVILDNRLALHARAPFEPRYDGRDRWLQRTLVAENLRQFHPWQRRSNRVLSL